MWMHKMLGLVALSLTVMAPTLAESACCYFAAKDKDVLQPAQKAFITWNPLEKTESFTVQPKFEGNAADFGMVIPTPTQPKLAEIPREFFKELAVFTILKPMDLSKYKQFLKQARAVTESAARDELRVRVLEAGIVGSLDYKIIVAERASDLYTWLKDNDYSYSGDEATLDFYIKKGWFFTVMKIDPKQMKKKPDGTYEGEITPTRFTFASEELIYPLKITQISVKDRTEALFYIQAPDKMDLPEAFSYQFTWLPMWSNAIGFAIPEKLTQGEKEWQQHVQPFVQEFAQQAAQMRQEGLEPATLEWAKRITKKDIAVLEGKQRFDRDVPKADVEKLQLLLGHVEEGQFITKIRKVFAKGEMNADLTFVRAIVGEQMDNIAYDSILPTSPP
ncbi:MAG: DUF2330 domain-containing protein [Candidatus Poribacteria bacterium]|nr:DUF2330 domain-containing protein [Candidatus Poribacteria bacterium]